MGDKLVIQGSVSADRAAGITVHVYSGAPGANGGIQGRRYLGSAAARPDGTWAVTLDASAQTSHLAATATDAEGNTSEFGGWSSRER